MVTKYTVLAVALLLHFFLFLTVSVDPVRSHGSIIYSRDQLLELRYMAELLPE